MLLSVFPLEDSFSFDDDSVGKYEVGCVRVLGGRDGVPDDGLLIGNGFMLVDLRGNLVFQSAAMAGGWSIGVLSGTEGVQKSPSPSSPGTVALASSVSALDAASAV